MSGWRFLFVALVFADSNATVRAEESATLIMPEYLHEIAEDNECRPFDNFYRTASAFYPPHVLGLTSESATHDAAFWCWREQHQAVLMFVLQAEYAGEIVFPGGPRGLRVVSGTNPPIAADPREIADPNHNHPRDPALGHRYIVFGDEVAEFLFYRKGIWYKAPGGH